MTRGGYRGNAGRKRSWETCGETKLIRVPDYLAEALLRFAHEVDQHKERRGFATLPIEQIEVVAKFAGKIAAGEDIRLTPVPWYVLYQIEASGDVRSLKFDGNVYSPAGEYLYSGNSFVYRDGGQVFMKKPYGKAWGAGDPRVFKVSKDRKYILVPKTWLDSEFPKIEDLIKGKEPAPLLVREQMSLF